eukprot:7771806-Pyramimonas_sp.AAC.1
MSWRASNATPPRRGCRTSLGSRGGRQMPAPRALPCQSPADFWLRMKRAARTSGSSKHLRDKWRRDSRMSGRCRACL